MKILDELWYGNISPFEQCNRGDKRLKELLKPVARNREEPDGTLTEKQKEIPEKFEECITHRGATTYFGIAELGRPSKFASEEAKKSQIV